MENLLELDKEWLLVLNGFHTPVMDTVMFWATKTELWIPLYVFLIILIIRYYKRDSWIILIGVAIGILLADQTTSHFMKPFFARLRPSQDPELAGLVHLVNGYTGGLYGFASSHASNTFATAVFCWSVLRFRHKWIWLLFLWATLMTYSRIYLGVHYPGDIIVGILVGVLASLVAISVSGYLLQRWGKNDYEEFTV
jgi:undecaprenyl-diphosphatase